MRTLIKGGTIVTAEQEYVGDILVEGDVIRAMGTHLDEAADLVIDAKGKYVFPGGVDQHTHFSALCNVGNRDTAGYETTDSAIVGGTTTIVDFAPQDPIVDCWIPLIIESMCGRRISLVWILHCIPW